MAERSISLTHIQRLSLLCVALLSTTLVAQKASSAHPIEEQAVVVSRGDIETAIKGTMDGAVKDAVLRVTSVNGKYNVGVSVVRRARVNGKTIPDALQHHEITEVYQVLSGSGILVTGGELVSGKEMPSDDSDVQTQIGPSAEGQSIKGGKSQRVAAGDVVIIPCNVPHGFSDVSADGISYVLVRIDPHRVLKTK